MISVAPGEKLASVLKTEHTTDISIPVDVQWMDTDGRLIRGERKTMRDLANSIMDGRMQRQTEALCEADFSFVVVENLWWMWDGGVYTGKVVNTIRGHKFIATGARIPLPEGALITKMCMELYGAGVGVVPSDCLYTSGLIVDTLYRLSQQDELVSLPTSPRWYGAAVSRTTISYARAFAGLGVGFVTAKRLSARFPTYRALIDASVEELCEVERIGPKLAMKLKEVLGE